MRWKTEPYICWSSIRPDADSLSVKLRSMKLENLICRMIGKERQGYDTPEF